MEILECYKKKKKKKGKNKGFLGHKLPNLLLEKKLKQNKIVSLFLAYNKNN